MARKPRIHFSGALYHVMLRGNDSQKIFFEHKDREMLNTLVEEGIKRYGHTIYAFCWMSNHIHLAIEVNDIQLSKIIQNIAFRYTRYINKKMKRIGHLFQGRYKAILVQKDSYLLELIRYIHLNPIRAKIVNNVENYKWSSHRYYLGIDEVSWIDSQYILSLFSTKRTSALELYVDFIQEGMALKGTNFKKGGKDHRIIGSDEFTEKASFGENKEKNLFSIELIIRHACDLLAVNQNELKFKTRRREIIMAKQVIGYINKHYGTMPNCELSAAFSIDPSTLSRAITNIEVNKKHKFINSIHKIVYLCENAITQV